MRIIVAIAFFSQWSGNGLVSYYLNKVLTQMGIEEPTDQVSVFVASCLSYTCTHTSVRGQLLINGILNIWNLAWALIASSMVERFGRRLLFLTSAGLMTIFLALQTACFARFRIAADYSAAHAALAFIFLFYAAYEYVGLPFI